MAALFAQRSVQCMNLTMHAGAYNAFLWNCDKELRAPNERTNLATCAKTTMIARGWSSGLMTKKECVPTHYQDRKLSG